MRHRSKDPRRYQHRIFVCQICGEEAPAGKIRGKTSPGHIKHMYCIRCREITEHRQRE